MQQVAEEAVTAGRKVAFLGRSMVQNVALAREMGFLILASDRVIDIDEVARYAPGEVCVICTGSQGEPMSALSLMAAHEHKHVKISADDVVVISAHAIPGNESNVTRVIDSLHRAGAEVLHGGIAPVHVSGHASQEELKFLLDLVQPDWFVPVHGEYRHLVHHALGRGRGRRAGPRARVRRRRRAHHRRRHGRSRSNGARCPRGTSTSTASSATSASACCATGATWPRRDSSAVIVTVDAVTGELVTGPEIVTRGWVYAPEAEELLEEAKAAVRASLQEAADEGATDFDTLRRHARRSLGKFINERTRAAPPSSRW